MKVIRPAALANEPATAAEHRWVEAGTSFRPRRTTP
jgi:hypothetical protein